MIQIAKHGPKILCAMAVLIAVAISAYLVIFSGFSSTPENSEAVGTSPLSVAAMIVSASFVIGPIVTLIGIVSNRGLLIVLGTAGYATQSVWLIFSLGWWHLILGVPVLVTSALWYWRESPKSPPLEDVSETNTL